MGHRAEQLRDWADAWNRGDLEALTANSDPDHEWVVAREHPAATTHRGPDQIRRYLEDWLRTMPGLQIEIVEIEEAGDAVLSVLHLRGSGGGSGAETEVQLATITTFRGGRPIRTEEFLDADEARRLLRSR